MDGTKVYDENYDEQQLISEAYELWDDINNFESDTRDDMRRDIEFESGTKEGVYDSGYLANRGDDQPTLNVPRINQFLNHVKNEMRQNKASIRLSPKGALSSERESVRIKTTENRQGLIRDIQESSQAVDAYQTAYDQAVGPGRGFIRVYTKYESNKTNNQEIVIEAINDGLDVYMSRHRTKKSYSDCKYGFILSNIPRKVFEVTNPDIDVSSWSKDANNKWHCSDDITIAEFYCTWIVKRELFETENGIYGYIDELKEMSEEAQAEVQASIKTTRTVNEPKIMWYKLTAGAILDKKEVIGSYIPIVPMVGLETRVNGRLHICGLTRWLKDICKMYNYCTNKEAEALATSIRAKYIAAAGQIDQFKDIWKNANKSDVPVLPYNPISPNGTLVPAPTLQQPVMVDSALLSAKAGYLDDMKAVSGIDSPSLGMMGSERSGVALKELKRGSQVANLHYIDNARICITQIGTIVNEWLPFVYDSNRVVQILGADLEPKQIELGGRDKDQDIVSLGDGDYSLVVSMGANYNTKRQESLDFMMELIRNAPQITPLIYDLLAKNMDSPGAQEISERLKKTIPPEILEEQGGEKQLRMQLQQATQQLQGSQQAIEMLTNQLEKAMLELKNNDSEIFKDLEVARINQEGKIAVENIKATVKNNQDTGKVALAYWQSFQKPQQTGVRQ